jgi:hypothetical protein
MPRKNNSRNKKQASQKSYESEDEIDFNDNNTLHNLGESENEEELDEFVQEHIDEFEQINTITNKMKELLEEIKVLKMERKEIETNLLNEIDSSNLEEGVFKYKNIKLQYSVKKTVNIMLNKKIK